MVPVWRLIFWEGFHCGEWHREIFPALTVVVEILSVEVKEGLW